jgi:hypothetical protein
MTPGCYALAGGRNPMSSTSQRVSRGFLNGWRRIGIVLSVVWMLVGAFWAQHLLFDHIYETLVACVSAVTDYTYCQKTYDSDMAVARQISPIVTALVALAPIPVVWLLAYGLIGRVRWIRAGFKR